MSMQAGSVSWEPEYGNITAPRPLIGIPIQEWDVPDIPETDLEKLQRLRRERDGLKQEIARLEESIGWVDPPCLFDWDEWWQDPVDLSGYVGDLYGQGQVIRRWSNGEAWVNGEHLGEVTNIKITEA